MIHRPGAPYPARIQPRDDELPDILKRSYYRPGIADIGATIGNVTGRQVTNKWVCDTPSQFRSELANVFNLATLKAEVLSLVSEDTSATASDEGTERIEGASDGESGDVE